jgi:hypothetical protein
VDRQTSRACSVAIRYLGALASQDWGAVTECLASDVQRRGPFGDNFKGVPAYVSYLQRTMPALPGYRMDIDGVTELGGERALVELRETIELDSGPFITHECLVFVVDSDGLLNEISIYIRQAPQC